MNCYAHGRIPSAPFVEIVSHFVSKIDMGEVYASSYGFCDKRAVNHHYSAIEAVAEWSGVLRNTLEKVLKGRSKTITFDFADRVLCATLGPGAWHAYPELNAQYERVSLKAA